jgi:hypothetical protein
VFVGIWVVGVVFVVVVEFVAGTGVEAGVGIGAHDPFTGLDSSLHTVHDVLLAAVHVLQSTCQLLHTIPSL